MAWKTDDDVTIRRLQKWHGAGNDFLVEVDGDAMWWTPERVRSLCARATGVGADGVLLANVVGEERTMVLFNADGTRAEMSGNGIRCLVAACLRAGAGTSPLAVVTDAGERIVTLELNGDRGFGEVAMGDAVVREGPAGTLGVVDVGNPHVVVRDNAGDDERTREESARGLSDAVGGANVEFVDVVSRDRVRLSVYERGAGWTLACGTGSVAVVAALRARGEVDDRVTVANPGGDLVVTADSSGYQLAGPVKFVADVEWSAA